MYHYSYTEFSLENISDSKVKMFPNEKSNPLKICTNSNMITSDKEYKC